MRVRTTTIGRAYYDTWAEFIIRNDERVTKTYNRFRDPGETMPDILRLRELYAEMDRAALDTYGWTVDGLAHGAERAPRRLRHRREPSF